MSNRLHVAALIVLAGLSPGAGLAAAPDASAAPATPPAAPPAVSTAATTPPVTPIATPAAPRPPEEFSSYVVVKGGWFGSTGDFEGDSFSGNGTWEIAAGTGRYVGFEIGSGSMTTSAGGLEVKTIPILLALRLQIPIAFVAPYGELGVGAYFNRFTVGDRTFDAATAGWHAGLGCDFLLGRLLLGAQARYMGIAPAPEAIGTVTLDRYELLLKAGVRF